LKGILLAGGTGTRLYPTTIATSKQLLPVYDKPMVYYPISTLMLAGIREILLITTPDDISRFKQLLGNGNQWGISIDYEIQKEPKGIPQAFIIGENFIGKDSVALILGDNIFYGNELSSDLNEAKNYSGATIFASQVSDPERYGIVEFDKNEIPTKIIEKPKNPKSKFAVTGLYFYDNKVIDISKNLKLSNRGEYEITDVNNHFLERGDLKVHKFGRGHAWLDTGTHDSLLEASQFVATIEHRQGLKIACLEEISYNCGFIDQKALEHFASNASNNSYGNYLRSLVNQ
tara:strand:+ start:331 stop:1194 length:864 start_codon:yes stop_codon:yes gene_type:complete